MANFLLGLGGGIASGYAMGRQARKDAEEQAIKDALAEAANVPVTQQVGGDAALEEFRKNYAPQDGGPATADEYIAANPETFKGLGGQKAGYTAGGQFFEQAPTAGQMQGLRAANMARAYEKLGKPEEAMKLSSMASQQEMTDMALGEKRREKAIMDRYAKMDLSKEFNDDATFFGAQYPGQDIRLASAPNGGTRITLLDRKSGKEVGTREVSADEFNGMRREALQKNMLAELSTISPEWYRFAKQQGVTDAQLKLAQDKFGEDKRQFGERMGFEREKHADDKYFKGEDLKVKHAGLGLARERMTKEDGGLNKTVNFVDKATGEVRPYTYNSKTGAFSEVKLPPGMTLPGQKNPTPYTEDEMAMIKNIDEQKLKMGPRPEGAMFKWGMDDPQNAYDAQMANLNNMDPRTQRAQRRVGEAAAKSVGAPPKAAAPGLAAAAVGPTGANNPEPAFVVRQRQAAQAAQEKTKAREAIASQLEELDSRSRGMSPDNREQWLRSRGYYDLQEQLKQLTVE